MIRAVVLAVALSAACPAWAGGPVLDPGPMTARASALLESGLLLEAVDAWQAVYEHAPEPADRAAGLVRMADVMAMFLDRGIDALALYDKAVAEFGYIPETANAVCNAAMARYERGDYAGAEQGFEICLRRWPTGPGAATAAYMRERAARDLARGAAPPEAEQDGFDGEPTVRVLLERSGGVPVSLPQGAAVESDGHHARWRPGTWTVTAGGVGLLVGGRLAGADLRLVPTDGRFRIGNVDYAGVLRLTARQGRVEAVNEVPLETYLRGVVPKEMPASWPAQALRAQAVAARSYAVSLLRRSGDRPYDVSADTGSQVYGGLSAADPATDAAVTATRGLVLTHDGRPALAYFHSHSGGAVEDDALVWSTDLPYLRAVDDAAANRARDMSWNCPVTAAEVAGALRKQGYSVQAVTGLSPLEVSPTGRLMRVRVDTDGGALEIKGSALRLALGATRMKSTLCTVESLGMGFVFRGRGFGHGVGMSQWGARGMAGQGRDAQDILGRYYPGADLTSLY